MYENNKARIIFSYTLYRTFVQSEIPKTMPDFNKILYANAL
jgi:hypothetical protein